MHVRTGERGFETMSMEYQVQENCLTIFLPKEVDHHNAEEVKKSADAIIEKEHIKYVIFDFEQTDFMDSSGIGVIMGRYRMICLIGFNCVINAATATLANPSFSERLSNKISISLVSFIPVPPHISA